MTTTPHAEYTARRDARLAEAADCELRGDRIARARLLLFLLAGAAIWLLAGDVPTAALVGVPLAAFVVLVVLHARVRRRLARARRAIAWYDRGLARLEGDFAGRGETGAAWLDDAHPYAAHLDVLGEGSLFELLCGARTTAGRRILAEWLLSAADPDEISGRQAAVAELRDRLDLREDLAVLDEDVVESLHAGELSAWATAPSPLPAAGLVRTAALALAGATAAAGVAAIWIGPTPLVWMLLVDVAFWLPLRNRVQAVVEGVDGPAPALRQIRTALERIEQETFTTARAGRIEAALGGHDPPASAVLGSLLKRIDALLARENMMFTPIALALLWGTNFSFAIERWRARHGHEVAAWIEAVGELEALLDLSRLAYERPAYVFPTVAEGPARFRARALAHPMLLGCTPNEVALGAGAEDLLVVTGSNMSGKSTLLRTVGVNAVLAQAGAPVRAIELDMSPVAVGASIRAIDSLLDGASRFYAEIRAIKRVVERAEKDPPALFLLDELLHGTNSEDRRVGAAAIVRELLEREAIGVVTTHDLALAKIADDLGGRARNAHFEFALDDGEIRFDYTLHPGVVRAGNALEIMRAAGLDV